MEVEWILEPVDRGGPLYHEHQVSAKGLLRQLL